MWKYSCKAPTYVMKTGRENSGYKIRIESKSGGLLLMNCIFVFTPTLRGT